MNINCTPIACAHPYGCSCAICRPGLPTPEAAEFAASERAGAGEEWVDVCAYVNHAIAKATRADDRLRAQRKRHAQRLAEVKAKLKEAEKTVTFLRGKIWDLEVRLKQVKEPSTTVRAILDRAIRMVREETKEEVPPCT